MSKNEIKELSEFVDDNPKDQKVRCCKKIEGKLYALNLPHTKETEYIVVDDTVNYNRGQLLIAETRYGLDIVEVSGEVKSKICSIDPIKLIREATKKDLEKQKDNADKKVNAFKICLEKIASHKLEMKLIGVHFLHEEAKVLFLFTSDGRVDFRELVKDLVATFHARIELRQIGVRDETRTLGGLAVCGRDFCCHGVSDQLKPVSIKMLKDQNLSLNSAKISGNCGRLLCCLSYEHDTYVEVKSKFPNDNTPVKYQDEIWRIKEINAISQKAILSASDGRLTSVTHEELQKNSDGKWFVKDKK